MLRCCIIITSVFTLLFSEVSPAQKRVKPRIVVLTTGGTIASRVGTSMTDGASLIHAVPELLDYADVQVEEFSRIGSSKMTPTHWLGLSKHINGLFRADRQLTGIVVTHGTDTMEETAFFLNLTVQDPRPVVLVGSMRAANEISADGPANLLNGVRVAGARASIGKGVLVVLNENIAAARDVWKTDNRRVHTFRSPELGFIGFADPDTVIYYRVPVRPHTIETEFDISGLDSLPAVEIAFDYTGSDGTTIDHLVSRRPDGLVVATFAGGRMSTATQKAVQEAVAAGIPLVVASRVPGGRIVGNPLGDLEAVVSRDLSPYKARILLMLALTRSGSVLEIQRMFDTY